MKKLSNFKCKLKSGIANWNFKMLISRKDFKFFCLDRVAIEYSRNIAQLYNKLIMA